MIKSELLQASAVLSHRGLKLASKWAAEQVVGIPVGQPASLRVMEDEEEPKDESSPPPKIQTVMQEELLNMTEQDWYAKSLVEVGEYLHAAAVLSQDLSMAAGNMDACASTPGSGDITHMGPPSPGLSSYGVYLRAYALYMAGERRKEEEYAGLERWVARNTIMLKLVSSHQIPDRFLLLFPLPQQIKGSKGFSSQSLLKTIGRGGFRVV
jgi:hypothetical protein